jgi:hypothetical protein
MSHTNQVDPHANTIFGFKDGEAAVIRKVGGRVTSRSAAYDGDVGQNRSGSRGRSFRRRLNLVLLHYTDCGRRDPIVEVGVIRRPTYVVGKTQVAANPLEAELTEAVRLVLLTSRPMHRTPCVNTLFHRESPASYRRVCALVVTPTCRESRPNFVLGLAETTRAQEDDVMSPIKSKRVVPA